MRFDKIENDAHRIIKWLERCHLLIGLHSKMSSKLRKRHIVLGVAIIITSGLTSIFHEGVTYFSTIIIVLASIQTFVGWGEESKQHLVSSKMYGDVMRKLEVEKSKSHHIQIDLSNIQNQIDLINHFAPAIDLDLFTKEDEALRKKLEETPNLISPISIKSSPISVEYISEDHLNLEKRHFGSYAGCPKNLNEYKNLLQSSELFMAEIKRNGSIIGFALWQRINSEIFHLWAVVVEDVYRNSGYGKTLIEDSLVLIKSQGGIYISLFTADEYLLNSLFREFTDPVGSGSTLNQDEKDILKEVELFRGLSKGVYGNKRVIENYYKMKDGKCLDASFRAFRL